ATDASMRCLGGGFRGTMITNFGDKSSVLILEKLVCLCLFASLFGPDAWSQKLPAFQLAETSAVSEEPNAAVWQEPALDQSGSISGKIVDQSGANIVGAVVKLTYNDESSVLETASDEDGLFAFSRVPAGQFSLTISSPGLTSQKLSAKLETGQAYVTPVVVLVIA